MTDHQQAAIEAGAEALWSGFSRTYGMGTTTSEDYEREAEITIAAAEPHLRKKWADEIREGVNPPDTGKSHEWRRGFVVGVLRAARFLEGVRG